MELTFLYHPVKNIEKAVAVQIPNSPIMVMLAIDQDPSAQASGFFGIDDVDAFYRDNRDRIDFVDEPQDLPPIHYASFRDPDENLFRLSRTSPPTRLEKPDFQTEDLGRLSRV